ncbi:MAG TPA: peptidoglycan DD-metalloendopeptidase family protein [Acidimicrobiia bacterium]|nr:peptidoglycan DD-metalloendopeptidase family protein [Acidimicrobiia bacterium]
MAELASAPLWSWRRFAIVTVVLAAVTGQAVAAFAEVTRAQLDEARGRVNAKQSQVDERLARLDFIALQQDHTLARIGRIRADIADRDREIALAELGAKERAFDMYINFGSSTSVATAISPESIGILGARSAYLDALVDEDLGAVNLLVSLQEDRSRLTGELEQLLVVQAEQAAEVQVQMNALLEELSVINTEYRALAEQWEREEAARERARRAAQEAAQRAAARRGGFATSAHIDPSGRTCPIAPGYGNSFRDSWLEPRPYRNGVHHGTDLVGATGTPLVAMENGTIINGSPSWHWAGGNQLYLRGDSGDIYYYAHLHGFAPGISSGTRVGVTQIIGYLGNTGASSTPHLHLGLQPGGGPMTNPYQLLLKLCR